VPNAGKSLLFQRLTRTYSASANYPYTTTRLIEKVTRLAGERALLLDTPGLTGLELTSEDEASTRHLLLEEPPDLVILCADATHLGRSLMLAAQLANLEIPIVFALNLVDEALPKGIVVDPAELETALGVPVVATCALDGRGVRALARRVHEAGLPAPPEYPASLEGRLETMTPLATRAHRVERLLSDLHRDLEPGQSLSQMVLEAHRHWAQRIAERATRDTGLEPRRSLWDGLAAFALHPLGGWVMLAATLVVTYLLVARVGAGLLADGLDRLAVKPILGAIAAWTGPGWLRELLVGPFGLLSLGLFNALATVLPILSVFYVVYGFLEDIGYFPFLSVQLDRALRHIGLTGRAVLPLTLALGCNTMATLATRSLENPRHRFIACFLIALGIPCAVQLGVMIAILSTVPLAAFLGLLLCILVLMGVSGLVLTHLLPRRAGGEFLLALPPLRRPRMRLILTKTGHHLWEFLVEAVPLFLLSAAVLYSAEILGLLDGLRRLVAPVVVRGLGMPRGYAEVLLMSLTRREIGAVLMKSMADSGQLDLRQIFVGLLVMTLFVPCMTNILTLGRVLGTLKATLIFVGVTAIALGAGVLVNGLWLWV
jgi:ferrous iron transport protein B